MEEEPVSLAEIAARRTERHSDAEFILTIDESDPDRICGRTYGDVERRAAIMVQALFDAGVSHGERVGCYLPNTPCWVVASLAAWWAGTSIAAVGTLLPAAEARRIFEMAEVSHVITTADAGQLAGFDVISIDEEGLLIGAGAAPKEFKVMPGATDLAAIFFTSGTTGRPKGIPHTHGDLVTAAKRIASGYARNTGYRPDPAPSHLAPGIVINPFGHTAGFVRLAFRMWIGRPTVLIPKFSVSAMAGYLRHYRPDSLQLTPTMVHMLATTDQDIDLSSAQYVTTSTAPLSTPTRELFEARFGVPVMQAYGMTEVGTVSQERLEDVRAGRRGPGSVGRPASGVEIKIRATGTDGLADDEGEILVRAKDMPTEFVGGSAVPVDEEGWFATGDIGRMDDGILYITGRAQEKIIVGGLNVYPAEVEDAMKRSHLVADAVVVGLADARLGERPVAGVVWSGEEDEASLTQELRQALAAYKVPRQLFTMEAVPLTARDKVDRKRALQAAREALDMTEPPSGQMR